MEHVRQAHLEAAVRVSPSKSCSEGQQRLHFVWKDLQGVWQQQASTSVCDGNKGEESIITLYTTHQLSFQSLLFFLYQLYTCLHPLSFSATCIFLKNISLPPLAPTRYQVLQSAPTTGAHQQNQPI